MRLQLQRQKERGGLWGGLLSVLKGRHLVGRCSQPKTLGAGPQREAPPTPSPHHPRIPASPAPHRAAAMSKALASPPAGQVQAASHRAAHGASPSSQQPGGKGASHQGSKAYRTRSRGPSTTPPQTQERLFNSRGPRWPLGRLRGDR